MSAGRQRRLRVEDTRLRVVLDLDQFNGVQGELPSLRRHQGHGLTLKPDGLLGEHLDPGAQGPHLARLARNIRPQRVVGDVLRQEHRRDPRQGPGS